MDGERIMTISLSLLPLAGAACLLLSVLEGWILALVMYVKWEPLKKMFPGVRDLIRSHVDYAMMGAALFGIYAVIRLMALELHVSAIVALIIGALYNPFGFLVKAVKPEMAKAEKPMEKLGILLGFIPATYGFGMFCVKLIQSVLANM